MGIFRGTAMRLTVAGTVAALGLTAAASPAVAAGTATWRVAYTGHRASGYDWMDAVVATGPANAWAFGGSFADGGQDAPLARHWDGRSWRKAVLPTGLERPVTTARATGPRDVWAFAGGDQGGDGYAIRWDGHRWTVMKRWPEGEIISDAAVLSSRDVWVFGNSRIGPEVGTWHYDGVPGRRSRLRSGSSPRRASCPPTTPGPSAPRRPGTATTWSPAGTAGRGAG